MYSENEKLTSIPIVDEYGISQAALKFFMALQENNSIPLRTAEFVKNCSQNLICDILSYLLHKRIAVLKTYVREKEALEN